MSKLSSCAEWVSLGLLVLSGCAPSVDGNLTRPPSAAGGSTSLGAGDGAGGFGGAVQVYSYPDASVTHPDGGSALGDPGVPSCGASDFAAEQVVVETTIEVPEVVTEYVTEDVPEVITEVVTEEVVTTKPVALYIMFDQSMSMNGPPFGTSNLWDPAVSALKAFANDPKSAGIGVALQYFPIGGGSCSTGAGYATAEVNVGLLPAIAGTFGASLDKHNPSGTGTPIEGALRGVTEFCKKYQAAHPDEQCVSVLVTDGEPELAAGCSENSATLAGIAKAAHDNGVTTFAVGLNGANFTLLDQIAKQGGAPDCDASAGRFACDVSSGAAKLSDALATIREKVVTYEKHTEMHTVTRTVVNTVTHTVVHTKVVQQVVSKPLPCEWSIPASPDGDAFDRDNVNIRLSSGEQQTTFVRVASKEACVAKGWYFDNFNSPTRFIACDQTCDQIEAAAGAKIDILLGCATIVPD